MNDERLEQLLRQAADADPAPAMPSDLADRVRRCFAGRRRRRRRALGIAAVLLPLVVAAGAWRLLVQTPDAAGVAVNKAGPPLRYGPGTPNSRQGATGSASADRPRGVTAGSSSSAGLSSGAMDSGATGVPPVTATAKVDEAEVLALRARVKQLQEDIDRLEARLKADAQQRQFEKRLAALRRELAKPSSRDLAMAEIEKAAYSAVDWARRRERQNRPDEARQEYQQVVKLFPNTSWAGVARKRLESLGKQSRPQARMTKGK